MTFSLAEDAVSSHVLQVRGGAVWTQVFEEYLLYVSSNGYPCYKESMKVFTGYMVAALLLSVSGVAQERTAGGNLSLEASWSALRNLANVARDKADVAQITANSALEKVTKIETCGKAGKIYAPGVAGADAQGCKSVVSGQSCSYTYSMRDLGGDGSNQPYYGSGAYSRCMAVLPAGYQFLSYDVCYEDGGGCSSDGLLCLFSKQTCTFN